MALCEAPGTPILDHPDCEVTLYATKKGAHEALRTRYSELSENGYKRGYGTLARGILVLERGESTIGLGLDYAGRLAS